MYKIGDEKEWRCIRVGAIVEERSSVEPRVARLLWRSGDAEVERNGFSLPLPSPRYLSREIGFQLWSPRLKRILDLLEFVIRVATMCPPPHPPRTHARTKKIFLRRNYQFSNFHGVLSRHRDIFNRDVEQWSNFVNSQLLPFDCRGPMKI